MTGASSALGQAIADATALDFDLLLVGRNMARMEALKERLPETGRHAVGECDLSMPAQIFDRLAGTISNGGPVEVLIHAAGTNLVAPLRMQKAESVEKVVSVNLLSAIELCRILSGSTNGRSLRDAVFISSISARRGSPGMLSYAAAKAGLESLCRTLAVEFSGRVNFVALALGPLDVEVDSVLGQLLEGIAKDHWIDAAAAAALIRDVLRTDISLISGQTLVADRAFSLRLALER